MTCDAATSHAQVRCQHATEHSGD